MKQNIKNLQWFLLACFILTALGLIYWQLVRAESLLARNDNPRPIIEAQRIKRGKIFTADGVALAESLTDENGLVLRHYPYPNLATVTGYYSLRYGTGGLEAAFDDILRGANSQTPLDSLMHRPPVGQNITVTIQLPAQVAADSALAAANATGAVIIMNSATGELLTMAGRPTFNPNTLTQNWEDLSADPSAPLLNRATQGLFPLGNMVNLAAYLALASQGKLPSIDSSPAENFTFISQAEIARLLEELYFSREIPFNLPSNAGLIPPDLPQKAEEIAVTPLHLALLGAALAQNGLAPVPTLTPLASGASPAQLALFKPLSEAQYAALPREYSVLVQPEITGNQALSWYLGLSAHNPPLVLVAVTTTPNSDPFAARKIALSALKMVE